VMLNIANCLCRWQTAAELALGGTAGGGCPHMRGGSGWGGRGASALRESWWGLMLVL
jgi:hypothetical protein